MPAPVTTPTKPEITPQTPTPQTPTKQPPSPAPLTPEKPGETPIPQPHRTCPLDLSKESLPSRVHNS
jgi:hypothetical protein